ncbi:hypothetical protein ABPG75_010380 [Micractinium tetrahymenae]
MMRVRKHPEEPRGPSSPSVEEEEGEEAVSSDEEDLFAGGDDREGSPPSTSTATRRRGRRKRGGKRPRLSWTPPMHVDFLAAVDKLGGPWTATPKAILESMDSPAGLTLTNIKSRLQKHRLKYGKEARAEQQRAAAAQAGLLAAFGGALPPLGSSRAGLGSTLGSSSLASAACMPGMVPVASVSPGPAAMPAPLLRNTLTPGGQPGPPLGGSAPSEPVAAAMAALAAARQQPELSFTDAALGAQAVSWRCRQQQALGAMAATLQQQQGPGGSAAALGPARLAVQAVPHRLLRLQAENMQCVKQLHALHMLQMQRHLEEAARLKGQAGSHSLAGAGAGAGPGGSGAAGDGGADAPSGGSQAKQREQQPAQGPASVEKKQGQEAPAGGPAGQAAALPPLHPSMPTLTAFEVMSLKGPTAPCPAAKGRSAVHAALGLNLLPE